MLGKSLNWPTYPDHNCFTISEDTAAYHSTGKGCLSKPNPSQERNGEHEVPTVSYWHLIATRRESSFSLRVCHHPIIWLWSSGSPHTQDYMGSTNYLIGLNLKIHTQRKVVWIVKNSALWEKWMWSKHITQISQITHSLKVGEMSAVLLMWNVQKR